MIAVTALLGLAACGSVSAGSAGHPASASADSSGAPAAGSLCTGRQSADRVVVSRAAAPRRVTLTGATQVQAMAAALCALPPQPAGQHCPAASAGSVRLLFAAGAQSFPAVTVQESGCRSVTGLGATRWWSGSAPLSVLLDEAAGGLGRLAPGTHPSSVPTGP
jgi:hypothetical protein